MSGGGNLFVDFVGNREKKKQIKNRLQSFLPLLTLIPLYRFTHAFQSIVIRDISKIMYKICIIKIIKTLVHTRQALCCYFTIINGILLFICFLMCVFFTFNNNNTHIHTHNLIKKNSGLSNK